MLSKAERRVEFFRRLEAAAACASMDEAYLLICNTLNGVEDEYTSIPNDPSKWMSDGRMYPPQWDSKRSVPGTTEVVRYVSKGHNTFIAANGALQIVDSATKSVVLDKAGRDGHGVEKWLMQSTAAPARSR